MDRLKEILGVIGQDDALREKVVFLCRDIESRLARLDFDVRGQVTGPILDALHENVGILQKRLRSGLIFRFPYTGRIARDLVMSVDPEPDHIWEPQTTKLLLHFANSACSVIVAGAYIGDHALLLAQKLKRHGGMCHCFEPGHKQFAILQDNARLNGLEGNLVLNPLALWKDDYARLRLVGEDELGRSEVISDEAMHSELAVITLNTYGEKQVLKKVDLMMIDVEGAERSVLEGSTKYLSQPSTEAPIIVFEVHSAYVDWSRGLENADVCQLLKGYGYNLFAVRDFQSNVPMSDAPIELVDIKSVYLEGPPHGFNMLAIKDLNLVEDPSVFRHCTGVSPKLLHHREPRLHQPLSYRNQCLDP